MADPKPAAVKMTALKYHTYDGKAYDAGDTYEAEESFVATLVALQMAKPTDQVKAEHKAAKADAGSAVMTTHDAPTKPKK